MRYFNYIATTSAWIESGVPAAFSLIFLGLLANPARAEEDYMETQRCVWRCLADSKGANDPAYGACVDRLCSGDTSSNKARSKRKSLKTGWKQDGANAYQASVSIVSRNRKFGMSLSCHRSHAGKISHGIFFQAPDGWLLGDGSAKAAIAIGGETVPFEVDGSEDGWVLSNAMVDNVVSVSPEFLEKLGPAESLKIISNNPKAKPAEVTFDTPNGIAVLESYQSKCARIRS